VNHPFAISDMVDPGGSGQVVIRRRCLGFQDLISHSGITISCRNYVQVSNATPVLAEGVAATGS
jgi:hypothetical protein